VRKIKVMADYDCWPLWETSPGIENVDPETLPISRELARDLAAWQAKYDATMVRDDPASSGFHDDEVEYAWNRRGRATRS
jgi:hypothetical protein